MSEFLGTGILTFVILSVQRSTIGVPFFIALAAGIALALSTYILHESSGAHFNPAITIAVWTARKISSAMAVIYIVMQLLGALLASVLYAYFANTHLQSIGGHYTTRILVAEAVGTVIFSFGIMATVYRRYTPSAVAVFSGVSYFIGIIIASAGNAALGLLNPAVALGVHAWVWGTYVLGPILGALIGVNLYVLLYTNNKDAVVSANVVAKAKKTSKKKS
ncbi:MAG TPA: aquaporin [Candidatus Sulfotelmatobacter sp.]|nr:aquaporin [Candidatus Sulfotelmatobacter sp.]